MKTQMEGKKIVTGLGKVVATVRRRGKNEQCKMFRWQETAYLNLQVIAFPRFSFLLKIEKKKFRKNSTEFWHKLFSPLKSVAWVF